MSGRFTAEPDVSPRSISSGDSVDVTLHYTYQPEAANEPAPEVNVGCSPTFAISCDPTPVTLAPAANGKQMIKITIKRIAGKQASPDECTLLISALNDERDVAVEVKR